MNKKQRREAAERKHEKFMEANRRAGMEALARDRERRERQERQVKAEAERRMAQANTKLLNAMFRRHD